MFVIPYHGGIEITLEASDYIPVVPNGNPVGIYFDDYSSGVRPIKVRGQIRNLSTGGRGWTPEPSSGFTCAGELGVDKGHVFALSLGGPNVGTNVVPMWRKDNRWQRWRELEQMWQNNYPGMRLTISLQYVAAQTLSRWATPHKYSWSVDNWGGQPLESRENELFPDEYGY